jgi:signal transduction histidine kinase
MLSGPSSSFPGGVPALMARLQQMPLFSSLCSDQAELIGHATLWHVSAGETFVQPGDELSALWVHLSGHVQLHYVSDGAPILILDSHGGELMGETPALSGMPTRALGKAMEDSIMLRIELEDFWQLMTQCHAIRKAVIGGMAQRIQETQFTMMQREKMIAIGTASAGLMHELNNPSAAAQRASAQLRKNLKSLQEISLRFCANPPSPAGAVCLNELQQQAYAHVEPSSNSSLEESEREEELAQWLADHGLEDAYDLASTLAPRGIEADALECAVKEMPSEQFADALHWLGSLSCSLELLQTVEDSVARINMLVGAVKMYSSGYQANQDLNVHDTIKSAIIILLYKIRFKDIKVEKKFAPDLPLIHVATDGLPQIWMNLIDNAIDAVPMGAHIWLSTELDGDFVKVTIADDGPGITPEVLPHIFEPFFTTKKIGVGTGLGLDIVKRKVEQCGGTIEVTSAPGDTRFIVRLPVKAAVS